MDADGNGRKELSLPESLFGEILTFSDISSDGRWFLYPIMESGETEEEVRYTESWYLLDTENGENRFLNYSSIYGGNGLLPGFSPDGNWLTYYLGLLPTEEEFSVEGSYRFLLNIESLADKSAVEQINVLGDGFPQSFQAYPYASFYAGIASRRWSPNNRFLAFSGMMDGPSSDLYIYDTISRTIARLTDGPGNIQGMIWSPDNKRILHSGSLDNCSPIITCGNFFVVSIDGSPAASIPDPLDTGGAMYSLGWLTDSKYVFHDIAN
jgi:Tol biopolymer transport system component